MTSRCIGPVVSGGMCVGLMYKFLSTLLKLMQHHTLHCNYTCWFGAVRRPAQHSMCNACILTMLYTYYPACDAIMGAVCTLVSGHIVLYPCMICMSYICHMLLSAVCHATRFLRFSTPTHLLQVVLS